MIMTTKTTSKKAVATRSPSTPVKRARSLRFLPDPSTLAEIGIKLNPELGTTLFGLVLNESRTGCAVILVTDQKLSSGMKCICRIGRLPDTYAEIRWVKKVEPHLLKIGLEYATI